MKRRGSQSKNMLAKFPVLGRLDIMQYAKLNKDVLMCLCIVTLILGFCLMQWASTCQANASALCTVSPAPGMPTPMPANMRMMNDAGIVLISISASCAVVCFIMQLVHAKNVMDIFKW